MPFSLDKAIELRSKCEHFRILVIGRANAGKTTLLKKVCNSIEDPEIFSPSGEKIHLSTVEGSAERGEHDINNQLIFKSNRQFVFHDSRGFESGSGDELNKVRAFIAGRGVSNKLPEQLHAIWYCLPTDTNRPLLAAEEQFFDTRITGKVPVIAIFTKFDGLITEAFSELMDEGDSWEDAQERQTEYAKEMLTNNFERPLMSSKFPPSARVRLDDMREETSNCNELIDKTANALSDDTLRLLFVSVQQNSIDLCIRHAVREALQETEFEILVRTTLRWFPHVWHNEEYDTNETPFYCNVEACATTLKTRYPHMVESLKKNSGRLEVFAAICICVEQTFSEASANKTAFASAFSAALNTYLGSTIQENVNREIAGISQQDNRAMPEKLVEIITSNRLRIHSIEL